VSQGARLSRETRGVLDDAACGLLRTDPNGLILWANRTFCQWIGWDEPELAGKRRLQDLLTMGGRIFHQTHWSPLLQIQGSVSEVKLEVVHRDGRSIPMVMNAIRRDADGAITHDVAAFVAHDRDKYERELVQSRKKLEQAVGEANRLEEQAEDRALFAEQMVGIVSHDLRNPLSTIQMGAIVLTRMNATPEQLQVLQRIKRAGDRALRLIADLLDFTQARLGKGLTVTPKAAVNVHDLVAATLEELGLAFPHRTLKHERRGQGLCSVDTDRLEQVIGNLVANAMSYGLPGTPVTVTSEVGADACVISVHNEGEPIRSSVLPDLFKPMMRGASESSPGRSVGLGLFIVNEIVKAHGGSVVADSGPAGTTFSARFPRDFVSAARP
jgi:phosphoserine phosphatase RsbU/P